jgi:arylsulfatase A-like enzyme
MPRPNIIYLHSHDTGRYIQPYGHAIASPNLQRLAEEGVLFRQAFAVAPTCSPSRAGLLTGRYPHNNGMLGLAHRGFRLDNYHHHLVHTLRPAGYNSTLIGVQHIAQDPEMIGYDRCVKAATDRVEHVAPAAVNFLDTPPEEPFFLSVGFTEVHRDFLPPGKAPADSRYCLPPPPLPDLLPIREDMAAFKAGVQVLDQGIGQVLDALAENGLAGNTLVVCTTDHGIAFPGMKGNLTDHGLGVMLILRGPGVLSGGKVVDAMVSHLDLFPTLCELLELDLPPWIQGRSLVPLLHGQVDRVNDAIFAEVNYHAAYEPMRAVRTARYKYIRRFGDQSTPVLPNCDDSPAKTVWLDHGWQGKPAPAEELFDLIFDPVEAHNLVNTPDHEPVLHEMRERLGRWMRETADPLLNGPVLAPAGVTLNDPGALSPAEPTFVVR